MKSLPKGGWIEILIDQNFCGVFPGGRKLKQSGIGGSNKKRGGSN
jgi:hypothetical protein